jgi:hypothetical protein
MIIFLLLSKQSTKKAWLLWIIGMPLATLALWYSTKRLFNMAATATPGWLTALTASGSTAHTYLLLINYLLKLFQQLVSYSRLSNHHLDLLH